MRQTKASSAEPESQLLGAYQPVGKVATYAMATQTNSCRAEDHTG